MLKFSTTMKVLELFDKMDIDFDVEFETHEELGQKMLSQVLTKVPKAQDEFLGVINEVCETDFNKESDMVEITVALKKNIVEIIKLFQSAFKLNSKTS